MTNLRAHRLATLLAAISGLWLPLAQAEVQVRVSAFGYDAVSGLLTKEVIEPAGGGGLAYCVATVHTYDGYGNKSGVTTRNCDGSAIGSSGINEAGVPVAQPNPVPTGSNPGEEQFARFDARSSLTTHTATSITVGGVAYPHVAGQFATSVQNALNHTEKRAYSGVHGQVLALEGPNGIATAWQYDSFGRKVLEARADGSGTKWEYLYCSNASPGFTVPAGAASDAACPSLSTSTGGSIVPAYYVKTTPVLVSGVGQSAVAGAKNGPESRTYYDSLNREVRSQSEAYDGTTGALSMAGSCNTWSIKDTQYDTLGRVARVSRPYCQGATTVYWNENTYDVLGRIVEVRLGAAGAGGPPERTDTTGYNGLTVAVTIDAGSGRKNQTKTTVKNAQGQTVLVTDFLSNTLAYTYDPFGNLTSTTKTANGTVAGGAQQSTTTTLTYDIRGRKTGMSDPDMGVWEYRYNALGELLWQQDPNGRYAGTPYVTSLAYDLLGRMTQRKEAALVSTWYYDRDKNNAYCGPGGALGSIGKLCQAETDTYYNRTHAYDAKGRPTGTTTTLTGAASKTYVSNIAYYPDGSANAGRIQTQVYPQRDPGDAGSRLSVDIEYTALGFAKVLKKTDGTKTWFTALEMNAEGQFTRFQHGNGVMTRQTYEAKNGNLLTQAAGTTSDAVLNYTYTYDVIGNLKTRENPHNVGRTQESFCYDGLNRLTHHTAGLNADCSGAGIKFWSYDGHGNIASTTDAASNLHLYNYAVTVGSGGSSRSLAHAVGTFQNFDWGNGTIANATFVYDLNGNMVNDADRYLSYNSFNLPTTLCTANAAGTGCKTGNSSRRVDFQYDAEHQRVWQKNQTIDATGTTTTSQTVYLNPGNGAGLSYERECQPDCDTASPNRTRHRHYLTLAGMVVAAEIIDSQAGGSATQYWHKDHLGSLAAVTTDAAPNVPCERAAYEAFGARQGIQAGTSLGNCNVAGSYPVPATDRGFTQHEHIEELNLIHMNGRVFDPVLGRFMQADPHVQYPNHTQAYNRYAYLLNNPLNATDPTGFFRFKDVFRTVVAVVVAYYTGYWVGGWAESAYLSSLTSVSYGSIATASAVGSVAGGAAGGFAGAFVASGGNLEAGLQGAVSGGLFGLAGGMGAANSPERYLAHAGAGCVSGSMNGGGCGRGAASAVAGKFVTNLSDKAGWTSDGAKFFAATIAGGTASIIAGGKFENGAFTSAFGYLFNQALSLMRDYGPVRYQGLGLLRDHLRWVAATQGDDFSRSEDFAPERAMLDRLRAGKATSFDVAFYHHEKAEADLMIKHRALTGTVALEVQSMTHRRVEALQGTSPHQRYHPDVVRRYPSQFGEEFVRRQIQLK